MSSAVKEMFQERIDATVGVPPQIECAWHTQNFGKTLVMKAGDPDRISHSICRECSAKNFPAKPQTIEVPSRSGSHVHSVNLAARKCSCQASFYSKLFCYHLRVARWSVWLKISVAEVLANLQHGKELFGCGRAGCSFCASGSVIHPGHQSYLYEFEMSTCREIEAA